MTSSYSLEKRRICGEIREKAWLFRVTIVVSYVRLNKAFVDFSFTQMNWRRGSYISLRIVST